VIRDGDDVAGCAAALAVVSNFGRVESLLGSARSFLIED
jgi:hypothetical protein